MKKFILPSVVILLFFANYQYARNSVFQTGGNLLNTRIGIFDKPAAKKGKDEKKKIDKFLTEIYQSCMVNIKAGVIASEKGTTNAIKRYGLLMVNEQATLKTKIEELARTKGVRLSAVTNIKIEKALENLQKKEGEKFDTQYIKMMKKVHQRDIRIFKKAMDISDKEVSAFAQQNLPITEEHLNKLKEIK